MKIKFDIECSPEEARALFGLNAMDPEALFKLWLNAAGAQGMEQMQKMWTQAAAGMGGVPGVPGFPGAGGGGENKK